MKRRFALSIIILFQLIIACKPGSNAGFLASEDLIDISYGTNTYNKMDIYLPADRNRNTRTVILIHGGYWYTGDKKDLESFARFFRDKGFACVTVNYRLTNTSENNIHPAQINDLGKAVEYLSSRASELHISSGRFGLLGVSAGAHLALLYTYASNSNGKIKSVVSFSGPSDLTDQENVGPGQIQVVNWLIGSSLENSPGAFKQASPVTHVNAFSKPTFIVHGKLDNIVPYEQSVDLKAELDEFGVKSELRLYDNVGHEFSDPLTLNNLLTDCAFWFDDTIR